jgi:hypothetical protein
MADKKKTSVGLLGLRGKGGGGVGEPIKTTVKSAGLFKKCIPSAPTSYSPSFASFRLIKAGRKRNTDDIYFHWI